MRSVRRVAVQQDIDAVRAVAEKLCLGPIEPTVVKLANHTTIRLAPLPLIARVQFIATHTQAGEGLARELSVAKYLVSQNAPTVRPAMGIDPGPHFAAGCVMTLWAFVPHRTVNNTADRRLAALALERWHAAFSSYPDTLVSFTAAIDTCSVILADATRLPDLRQLDRAFLGSLHAHLSQRLSRHTWNAVPLHGDAHLGNVLMTDSGAVWADLEATCIGPVEWDVASLPKDLWREFNKLNLDLSEDLANLRSLCTATWCWADLNRSAEVNEAAAYHLRLLRSRFD